MSWAGTMMLASLAAIPAAAQTLGQAHEPEISLWRVVGALVFCCLLGAAGALALKYRMQGRPVRGKVLDMKNLGQVAASLGLRARREDGPPARLQVIETVRLSYQVEVSLLECDGVSVMLVTSPHGAFVVNRDAPEITGGKT